MSWLYVFVGGGLGALSRYGVARLLLPAAPTASYFPWATFAANFLACIVLGLGLGLIARQQLPPAGQLLLLTGFCGGFSTFSTFAAELLELLQAGSPGMAVLYLTASVVLGILSILAVLYLLPAGPA